MAIHDSTDARASGKSSPITATFQLAQPVDLDCTLAVDHGHAQVVVTIAMGENLFGRILLGRDEAIDLALRLVAAVVQIRNRP